MLFKKAMDKVKTIDYIGMGVRLSSQAGKRGDVPRDDP